jgi:hypothetical protein
MERLWKGCACIIISMKKIIGGIEMNIINKFLKSLYDFKSYRAFKKQSGFSAFIYALLVSLILGGIAYGKNAVDINNFSKGMAKEIEAKVPQFEVKNEVLYIEGSKHIEITTSKSNFILDSTGDIESIASKKNTGVFLGKDSVIIKQNGIVTVNRKYSVLSTYGIEINRKVLLDILPLVEKVGIIYLGVMVGLFVLATYFKIFIMALFGRVVCSKKFGARYKLSIYAISLPLLLSALMTAFNIEFMFDSTLLMIIGLCYLHFGSKAIEE